MNASYNLLLKNINAFIRKYYTNLLIKGGLYTIAITISFFLAFVLLEYFFYLGSIAKISILLIYLMTSGATLIGFVLIPLFRLTGILPQLSIEEASLIIGNHFPDIRDKLLNTVQLFDIKEEVDEDILKLLNASIEQKALKISVFNFRKAINFRVNRRYLKFALPPLTIVIVLLLSAPSVIINPTERLLNYDSTFVPSAPFQFVLLNDKMTVEEGKDYKIQLLIKGETVPDDVVLNIDGFDYIMQKDSKVEYHYQIKNIRKPVSFHFTADKFKSTIYKVNIYNTPKVSRVLVKATFPKYLNRKSESIENLMDLVMPEGTSLKFNIFTEDVTDFIWIKEDNSIKKINETKSGVFAFSANRIKQSINYQFLAKNQFVNNTDTLSYHIQIVNDEYPKIRVNEFQDSVYEKRRYFKGLIKDDYGFSRLFFEVKYKNKKGEDTIIINNIPIIKSIQNQDFLHFLDMNSLNYLPGTDINYSFVVYDNDGVNGPKMSRTQRFSFSTKTKDEETKADAERSEAFEKSMASNILEARELSRKLNEITERLKGKKSLTWQEKKEINELLEQYKELQKKVEKAREENRINIEKAKENGNIDEEIKRKQEELNKLMEEIMTPEMKELLKKFQEMMENNAKKEDVDKALEEMKTDAEFIKNQLERDLEFMKQLKFDQKFQQAIDKIDELQRKQEELSELSKDKKYDAEKLKKQQDSLNSEFEEFSKMMDEARKANEDLEHPNSLQDTKSNENEISEEMKESSNELSKGKRKSASGQQKSASSKMKSLKEQMQSMQSSMQSQSNAEDMENLKNIMQNLIEISFKQEKLMNQVKNTSNRDPKFPEYVEQQKRISQDLAMVEDSLMKLAKRNPSISPFVNKEIQKIHNYSERTFLELKELNTIAPSYGGQIAKSSGNQQFIMTSVNNLALMLSEILNQMQQQQMQKSGKGSCNKPKPGAGNGMKSLRQMQEALQKQMEQMQKQMEKMGKNKGGKGKNGQQQSGGEKMSEEFAKMAAQQEAIRKQLQQYRDKMAQQGRGKEAGELDKIAREMEQNETDLVNRIITQESLIRQKNILSRLLESEKAEREREKKEERESKEGKNQKKSNKNLFFQYKDNHSEDIELLKSIPPELRPFYKKLVDSYFGN